MFINIFDSKLLFQLISNQSKNLENHICGNQLKKVKIKKIDESNTLSNTNPKKEINKTNSLLYTLKDVQQKNEICIDVRLFKMFKSNFENYFFKFSQIKLVGPYSTAARHIFSTEHAILIACNFFFNLYTYFFKKIFIHSWYRNHTFFKHFTKCLEKIFISY